MRIGIDLGGSKIEGVALTGDGAVAAQLRVPTPQHDYAATIAAIAHVVRVLEAESGADARVGVGAPGSPARAAEAAVWQGANATWINGRPLAGDLAAALHRDIRIANDANCFAVSEATDGAAAGAGVVFGAILGSGVGGGLVVSGRPVAGANGIAGEWGHMPLPWPRADERPGPPCFCGRRGCVETWVAAKSLERDWRDRGGAAELNATAIADAAAAGDALAGAVIDDWLDRLARGLAVVVGIVDPDVVVLGGGASRIAALYDRLPALVARHGFGDGLRVRIVRNRHGDASGVRGAAQLWRPGE